MDCVELRWLKTDPGILLSLRLQYRVRRESALGGGASRIEWSEWMDVPTHSLQAAADKDNDQ